MSYLQTVVLADCSSLVRKKWNGWQCVYPSNFFSYQKTTVLQLQISIICRFLALYNFSFSLHDTCTHNWHWYCSWPESMSWPWFEVIDQGQGPTNWSSTWQLSKTLRSCWGIYKYAFGNHCTIEFDLINLNIFYQYKLHLIWLNCIKP